MTIGLITKLAKVANKLLFDAGIRQDLLDSSMGASVVWWQQGVEGVARSIAAKLGESVSVRDFMTAAEIADSNSTLPVLDHTPAFRKAIAYAVLIGAKRVWIDPPLGYYNIKELDVPIGIGFAGWVYRPYVASFVDSVRGYGSVLVMIAGATYFIKWGGRNTIDGIILHGRDRTQRAFDTLGGQLAYMNVLNSAVFRCSTGFGNPTYMAGAYIANSNFSGNTVGISSLIDSQVHGGFVNANETVGISCAAGANDNFFNGVKNEWNGTDNWSFFGSVNNNVNGGVTDRAGGHNFRIGAGSMLTIGGAITVRRGGRVLPSSYNFYVESVAKLTMTGINTARGPDDGGSGTITPNTCMYMTGTNGQIIMGEVDLTGGVTNGLVIASGTTFDYLSIRDCPGTPDYFDRPGNVTRTGSVLPVSTVNVPVKLTPVNTYSRATYKATITARSGAGTTVVGSAIFYITREAGNALAGAPILDWAGTGFGVLGSETISMTMVNVAPDGSTADIAVKNTHATNDYTFSVVVNRA